MAAAPFYDIDDCTKSEFNKCKVRHSDNGGGET